MGDYAFTLRAGLGRKLTSTEVDNNFLNLYYPKPNLIANGSGEFGTSYWNDPFNAVQIAEQGNSDTPYFATKVAMDGTLSYLVHTQIIPQTANVGVCVSGDVFTGGLTQGRVYFKLEALDSNHALISQFAVTQLVGTASGWQHLNGSGITPANTAYVQVSFAFDNNPRASNGGIAWRRVKVEGGLYPTPYDPIGQLISLYLNPIFGNRPVWNGFTPWDSGNFDPTAKFDKTGGAMTGNMSAPNVTAASAMYSQAYVLTNGITDTPSIIYNDVAKRNAVITVGPSNARKFFIFNEDGSSSAPIRPTWDGATPWDSENFNPGGYLPISGGTLSGTLTVPKLLSSRTTAPDDATEIGYLLSTGITGEFNLPNNTFTGVTVFTLSPGVWDVVGWVHLAMVDGTSNNLLFGIATANSTAPAAGDYVQYYTQPSANSGGAFLTPVKRFVVAAGQTQDVYLIAYSNLASGTTQKVFGKLEARKVA